jgi:ABC-type transporter Mla maintaining outer membrane lipid asymmetry ATPase subunit MlaF
MFSVYNIADHVIMLHEGKVQFDGTVEQLRASTDPVVVEFLERFEHTPAL